MFTIPTIPTELVLAIMEAAYYDAEHQVDTDFLSTCALVCKDWSLSAQKLLFRSVHLQNQASFKSFVRALDTASPRGNILANAVLRLKITLDHSQPTGLSQESLASAVIMCPNVYELNLSVFGCGVPGQDIVGSPNALRMARKAPSWDPATLVQLRSATTIKSLQFHNWSDNSTSLVQLLELWPRLQSVSISGMPPELPASLGPFAANLHEVQLNFQTAPTADFLEWMLHQSTDSLRVLRLEREAPADLVDFLLERYGSGLASLYLPGNLKGSNSGVSAKQLQERCPKLKEFSIESSSTSLSLLKALPEGLEHVAFSIDDQTSLLPALEVVKKRKHLRGVSVQLWHGGEENPQMPSLHMACALRGIEIRTTKEVRVFRTLVVSSSSQLLFL